jgi:hypothetical protein
MEKQFIPWSIWGVVIANIISILVIFVVFMSRQQEALNQLSIHTANTLPGQPSQMPPDVGSQLVCLGAALFFGILMNHLITTSEISHLYVRQKGGEL